MTCVSEAVGGKAVRKTTPQAPNSIVCERWAIEYVLHERYQR